jgi:hypothetical protein
MLPLWLAVVVVLVGTTLVLARTRWAWLSAGVTVAVALPRLFVYDVTFLMPAAVTRSDQPGEESTRPNLPHVP